DFHVTGVQTCALPISPGFWDDQNAAQAILRKRAALEAKVNLVSKLDRELRDVADYLELAAEEGDDGALADAAAQIDELAGSVREIGRASGRGRGATSA